MKRSRPSIDRLNLITRLMRPALLCAVAATVTVLPLIGHAEADDALLWRQEQAAIQAAVDRVAPAVVRLELVGVAGEASQTLTGQTTTGLIVDSAGHIVTSSFGFGDNEAASPPRVLVELPGGSRQQATYVGRDYNRKLVLLRVDAAPLPIPEFAPEDSHRVGMWAIALGRTFDADAPNVNVGIISALKRIQGKALQTDANTSPNNYGGPLVDLDGRVLGLIAPLMPGEMGGDGTLWYDSGIGFAVPIEDIIELLPRWEQEEDLHPAAAQFAFSEVGPLAMAPVIGSCPVQTPAFAAGLRQGDRVVACNGAAVARAHQVTDTVACSYAGDELSLTVQRGEDTQELVIPLVREVPPFRRGFLGILARRDTARLPFFENSDNPPDAPENAADAAGITIAHVYPDGPAAEAKLRADDRIEAIDGVSLRDDTSLRELLRDYTAEHAAEVAIRRDGQVQTVSVRLTSDTGAFTPPQKPVEAWGELPELQSQDGRPVGEICRVAAEGVQARAVVYCPANPVDQRPLSMLIILGDGRADGHEVCAQWQPAADATGTLVVAFSPQLGALWQPRDLLALEHLFRELPRAYPVDPCRVAVLGQQRTAPLAWRLALRMREHIRGLALAEPAGRFSFPRAGPQFDLQTAVIPGVMPEGGERLRDRMRESGFPADLLSDPLDAPAGKEALGRWLSRIDRL